MSRDLTPLTSSRLDLVVIGGGIHGLFTAYDAAARGLSVALVEKADYGSGLSFNHQRTLHGGLRALQHGQLGKARQQILERRTWARIAPHLVRPIPFLIGTYRGTSRSRLLLRAGLKVYDFIGRHRNVGVSQELHVPKTRLESAAATRRLFPGIADRGLTGGAIWYDYQTIHPDRLLWTVALAARQKGAQLFNYVEAVEPIRTQGRITGWHLCDALTGQRFEAQAAATVIAAGAGVVPLLSRLAASEGPPLLRAMNLLIDRPARDIALAASGASGRMLTAVPWAGRVLIGTFQSAGVVDPNERQPPAATIETSLADAASAFPSLRATRADVRFIHYGLVPAQQSGSKVDLLPEPQIIRHSSDGLTGLITVVGVKFTTARRAAERAVNAVCDVLGRPHGRSTTASIELPHAGVADVEGRLIETQREIGAAVDLDVMKRLGEWYGTEAPLVLRHAAAAGHLARLAPDTTVIEGDVSYAVDHADARRLTDVVLRRTPLGSAGHPGHAALERAAAIMGARLGWDDARQADEVLTAAEVYRI